MKRSTILPFLALAGVMLLVGLACGVPTSPTAVPTIAPQPTQPVPPTQAPPPTIQIVLPTNTSEPLPTDGPSDFFTEEFITDPGPNWDLVVLGPNKDKTDKLDYYINNDALRFEINAQDLYAYYFYTPYYYTDVRLDMRVENIGVNSQNISLICRAKDDEWYEFSVGSDGMWYLYAHKDNGNYDTLAMAGAATLRQGHAVNDYAMSCIGDQIHMYVNDTELPYSPFKPLNYYFTEGEVGFNISSLQSTPVITDVYWFQISQP